MKWVVVCIVAAGVIKPHASHAAPPRTILVLPLDGHADAATRTRLDGSVRTLAKTLDGTVSVGDTTFEEAAAAVGCEPTAPSCADNVRVTLGVDELVYGTATTTDGQTKVTVWHTSSGAAPRQTTATVGAKDGPPQVEAALKPLFLPPVVEPTPIVTPQPIPASPEDEDHRERNKGVILVAGGGALLLVGLVMWSGASSRQAQIDAHAANTAADFQALRDLESQTLKYAVLGDLLVAGGLAVGGYGGWILYQDHQAHAVTLAPTVVEHGAAISLGGVW